jgi:hypothetical protein
MMNDGWMDGWMEEFGVVDANKGVNLERNGGHDVCLLLWKSQS